MQAILNVTLQEIDQKFLTILRDLLSPNIKSISLNNDDLIFYTKFSVFQQGILKIFHVFCGKTDEKI